LPNWAAGERFSLIFLDPPYGRGLAATHLLLLAGKNLLAPDGCVIVEHSRLDDLAEQYQDLRRRPELMAPVFLL
jgi:16S rRNA G966 N2-methylase RsmD